MTKPIPEGGERKRPARSCVTCRASKLRCSAIPSSSDGDGPAEKPCDRCEKFGINCEFVALRRKGRPRRLVKIEPVKADDEGEGGADNWVESGDEDEATFMNDSPLSTTTTTTVKLEQTSPHAFTATPSPSPNASGLEPVDHRADADLHALAAGYISDVHPFLPLLSNDLYTLIHYLRHTTPLLSLAVATLVYPRSPLDLDISQLGHSIADVQAAVILIHASFGRGNPIKARITLRWVGAHIMRNGWHLVDSPHAPARDHKERDQIRRIFFETWGLEVILAMNTGVRLHPPVLQGVSFEVDPVEHQAEGSPSNLKIRALSLVAAGSEPPSASTSNALTLASISSICTSIGLLGHQAYVNETNLVEREAAFMATMLSSAALIHFIAASYASTGFTCGLDPTVRPSRESREFIRTSSNMIFATLRDSLRPGVPRTRHSPFWGCALLAASHGLLLSMNTFEDGEMELEGDEWRRAAIVSNLEVADWVLRDHKARWRSVEKNDYEDGTPQSISKRAFGAKQKDLTAEQKAILNDDDLESYFEAFPEQEKFRHLKGAHMAKLSVVQRIGRAVSSSSSSSSSQKASSTSLSKASSSSTKASSSSTKASSSSTKASSTSSSAPSASSSAAVEHRQRIESVLFTLFSPSKEPFGLTFEKSQYRIFSWPGALANERWHYTWQTSISNVSTSSRFFHAWQLLRRDLTGGPVIALDYKGGVVAISDTVLGCTSCKTTNLATWKGVTAIHDMYITWGPNGTIDYNAADLRYPSVPLIAYNVTHDMGSSASLKSTFVHSLPFLPPVPLLPLALPTSSSIMHLLTPRIAALVSFAAITTVTADFTHDPNAIHIPLERRDFGFKNADGSFNIDAVGNDILATVAKYTRNRANLKSKGIPIAPLESRDLNERAGYIVDDEKRSFSDERLGAVASASDSRMLKSRGTTSLYLNGSYTYSAAVQIGTPPQLFNIFVDTGSTDFAVGASGCTSCGTGKAQYKIAASSTAADQGRMVSSGYADGSSNTGEVVKDTFRVASSSFTGQTFISATSLSSTLQQLDVDGMGMAYASLGVAGGTSTPFTVRPFLLPPPSSNQPNSLRSQTQAQAQGNGDYFALRLSDRQGFSELAFGNIDRARVGGQTRSFPVLATASGSASYYTYWQIGLSSPTVDGVAVLSKRATHILDSGSNFIFAPPADAQTFWAAIPGSAAYQGIYYTYPCDSTVQVAFEFSRVGASWNNFTVAPEVGGEHPDQLLALSSFLKTSNAKVATSHKEWSSAVNKFGKSVDKKFCTPLLPLFAPTPVDPPALNRSLKPSSKLAITSNGSSTSSPALPSTPSSSFSSPAALSALNETIALHLARIGSFQSLNSFLIESSTPSPPMDILDALRSLHVILSELGHGVCTSALGWVQENPDADPDKDLEFELRKEEYIRILLRDTDLSGVSDPLLPSPSAPLSQSRQSALHYAGSHFNALWTDQRAETICALSTSPLFMPFSRLLTSPYRGLYEEYVDDGSGGA
ncbi:hypothetical protein P7C70_g6656, partial [Phenoliferia sp. Uapishka_3]